MSSWLGLMAASLSCITLCPELWREAGLRHNHCPAWVMDLQRLDSLQTWISEGIPSSGSSGFFFQAFLTGTHHMNFATQVCHLRDTISWAPRVWTQPG